VPEAVKLSAEIRERRGASAAQPFDVLSHEAVARGVRKELGRLVHWTILTTFRGITCLAR